MEKGRLIQSTRNAGAQARAQFALSKVIPILPLPEVPFTDIDSEDDEKLENNEILQHYSVLMLLPHANIQF